MADKPTYEELEQRVREIEEESLKRKQIKRAMLESEEKYRHLSEGTFEAVVWHDKGKIIEANKQYYELFGYKPEELAEKDAILLTATPDSVKFMREQISLGNQGPYEVVGMKKDATEFPMEIRVKLMKYKGKMARMAAIRDLAERKQAEKALLESEARYRAVVESQTEMICRFLPDGTLTFVNEAYCRYFGKSQKELIGQSFLFLIPEDDRKKVLKNIASFNQNNPVMTHEHKVIDPNGETCWHRWTNRAIFDDQNKLLEFQSVGWDITERVRTEKALMESEERYRRLVETMNDGFGILDEKGGITYVNSKFAQMLGYKPENLIGKPVTDLLDDRNKQILKNQISIRKKGKVSPYEIEWVCKDGKKIPTIMSPQAIFDEKGQFQGSFSVITDISILKQVEEELRKVHDDLEKRVEERTKELEIQRSNLEETNIALQVLLEKRREDKKETEDNVLTNVKELIVPYIEKIRKTKLDDQQKATFEHYWIQS